MTGIYDNFKDTPDQIKYEGQEISITFKNQGDGTGLITWNIPKPFAGCKAEDQAYNGIVITISNEPAKFTQTSPVNAKYYASDNTVSDDSFMGDDISGAKVVGAFYNDKEKVSLLVTGIEDNVPYYVSGYAVDDQARYHTEGVHAYSLPSTNEKTSSTVFSAFHDIVVDSLGEAVLNTKTGLAHDTEYYFNVKIDCKSYNIKIHGSDAITYNDLVNAVNLEFSKITKDVLESPHFPNKDLIFRDGSEWKIWNGEQYENIDVLAWDLDPTTNMVTYWWNGEQLIKFNGYSGSFVKSYIDYHIAPHLITAGTVWFDGFTVRVREQDVWCDYETITSTRNPLLPPVLTNSSYWYDTSEDLLFKWDTVTEAWKDQEVIFSSIDPQNIPDGYLWYDLNDDKLYSRVSGAWNELNFRNESHEVGEEPLNPMALSYWYNPTDGNLYQRDLGNTTWNEVTTLIKAYDDPADRQSCDLWWAHDNPSFNGLLIWDKLNNMWVTASDFYETDRDPSLPPDTINAHTAWHNPDTGEIVLLMNSTCMSMDTVIRYTDDPLNLPDTTVWYDNVNDKWYVYASGLPTEFQPAVSSFDPMTFTIGQYWYDTVNNILYLRNDTPAFEQVEFSVTDVKPEVNTLWLNTNDDLLYKWDGSAWVEGNAFATLYFIDGDCKSRDILRFATDKVGCEANIEIMLESDNLFANLTNSVMYLEPTSGKVLHNGSVMYKEYGIGTTGDPSARRELHNEVRSILGHPGTQVELTKQQIDIALDNALLVIRKYSSFGYKRGFFFLRMNPNQQRYVLNDKCVGFHQITEVRALYRMRSGFLHGINHSAGLADTNVFGFAAFQQLYATGTFDMLSYHMVSSYIEDLQRLFADHIMFQWREETRELRLYKSIYSREKVLVDAYVERTEQELFNNRETRHWIKRWATAESKMILSQIRGKFQSLPGPNGSTTLNSQELITQAENEKAELMEEIQEMGMQDVVDVGMQSHFIIG